MPPKKDVLKKVKVAPAPKAAATKADKSVPAPATKPVPPKAEPTKGSPKVKRERKAKVRWSPEQKLQLAKKKPRQRNHPKHGKGESTDEMKSESAGSPVGSSIEAARAEEKLQKSSSPHSALVPTVKKPRGRPPIQKEAAVIISLERKADEVSPIKVSPCADPPGATTKALQAVPGESIKTTPLSSKSAPNGPCTPKRSKLCADPEPSPGPDFLDKEHFNLKLELIRMKAKNSKLEGDLEEFRKANMKSKNLIESLQEKYKSDVAQIRSYYEDRLAQSKQGKDLFTDEKLETERLRLEEQRAQQLNNKRELDFNESMAKVNGENKALINELDHARLELKAMKKKNADSQVTISSLESRLRMLELDRETSTKDNAGILQDLQNAKDALEVAKAEHEQLDFKIRSLNDIIVVVNAQNEDFVETLRRRSGMLDALETERNSLRAQLAFKEMMESAMQQELETAQRAKSWLESELTRIVNQRLL